MYKERKTMINSVTFAGREECLTKQIKQAATKAPDIILHFQQPD